MYTSLEVPSIGSFTCTHMQTHAHKSLELHSRLLFFLLQRLLRTAFPAVQCHPRAVPRDASNAFIHTYIHRSGTLQAISCTTLTHSAYICTEARRSAALAASFSTIIAWAAFAACSKMLLSESVVSGMPSCDSFSLSRKHNKNTNLSDSLGLSSLQNNLSLSIGAISGHTS